MFLKNHYPKLHNSIYGSGKNGNSLPTVLENGCNKLTDLGERIGSCFYEKMLQNGSRFYEKMEAVSTGDCNNFTIKINGKNVALKKQQTKNRKGVQGKNTTITELRVCYTCGISIEHKRAQAVYCSKKCKNQDTNKNRNRRKANPTPSVPKTKKPKAPEPEPLTGFDIKQALETLAKAKKV
jgi:predicted nucleic acid-binding Zn ribbon protein